MAILAPAMRPQPRLLLHARGQPNPRELVLEAIESEATAEAVGDAAAEREWRRRSSGRGIPRTPGGELHRTVRRQVQRGSSPGGDHQAPGDLPAPRDEEEGVSPLGQGNHQLTVHRAHSAVDGQLSWLVAGDLYDALFLARKRIRQMNGKKRNSQSILDGSSPVWAPKAPFRSWKSALKGQQY